MIYHQKTCVIFDMDGTLADTAKITIPAILRAASETGREPPAPQKVLETIGISGVGFYAAFYPEETHESHNAFGQQVERYERELTRELGKDLLFPGVARLLDNIIGAGGLCALASTGDGIHVNSVLTNTGILDRFWTLQCGDNDKVKEIAAILRALPGYRFFMVGDKPKDSHAANENRVFSIGAGYGFSRPEELAGFDAVAASPAEVMEIIIAKENEG